jgi:ATP-dependent protease ClpP protease subunit
VHTALERDNFLTTEQALEFGLIDRILTERDTPVSA